MEKSEGRVDFSSLLARSFKSSSVAALESSLSVSRCEGNHQTSKGTDEASDESDVSEVFHGLFERSWFGFDIYNIVYKADLVNQPYDSLPTGSASLEDEVEVVFCVDQANVIVGQVLGDDVAVDFAVSDPLSGVVVPKDHCADVAVSARLFDVEDDVTVGIDSAVDIAEAFFKGLSSFAEVTVGDACLGFLRSGHRDAESEDGASETESESFDGFVHSWFERVCLVEGYPPLHY